MKKTRTALWGTANAIMAISSVKKSEVVKMLPPAVALSPQTFTPEDEHPVVFLFNKQRIRLMFRYLYIDYYEFIPLIPLVHFRDNPNRHYQMSPILYVNSRRVVFGATVVWPLNKVMAKFSFTPAINDFFGAPDIVGQIDRSANTGKVLLDSHAEGKIGIMKDFPHLENFLPHLNTDAIISSPTHDYWTANYRIKTSIVQGMRANVGLDIPELRELKSFEAPSISQTLFGAFRIKFSWTLARPIKYHVKRVQLY
ncbi:MAG: hypothetical protein EAZ95_02025 [Bacteroidetes bacterium]|nr:MAG: hypothetical protein EAZ95_02025 [Bacteroidota bacterium]